ncbi:MAG: hypothetical protein ABSF32_10845 [Ignavibacteria bacterium]|jgi:hypothetical protein
MSENKEIKFTINGLYVTKFNIDLKEEYIKIDTENKGKFNSYTFEIKCNNKGYVPQNIINIETILKIFLDSDKKIELGSIQVENVYTIDDLKNYYIEKENRLNLPSNFEATLISISIAHTRAIMHTKCAGTFLQNALLPLLNPTDFLKIAEEKRERIDSLAS